MAAGRKPKPTALKKLTGNPGKRALNKQEPRLPADMPVCPGFLDKDAKAEWKRVAGELHKAGVITLMDRALLAVYCDTYSRWVETRALLENENLLITTAKGNLIQNPLVGMLNKLGNDMAKYAAEFGMTPSSRSRVSAIANSDEDELEASLFGLPVKVKK